MQPENRVIVASAVLVQYTRVILTDDRQTMHYGNSRTLPCNCNCNFPPITNSGNNTDKNMMIAMMTTMIKTRGNDFEPDYQYMMITDIGHSQILIQIDMNRKKTVKTYCFVLTCSQIVLLMLEYLKQQTAYQLEQTRFLYEQSLGYIYIELCFEVKIKGYWLPILLA